MMILRIISSFHVTQVGLGCRNTRWTDVQKYTCILVINDYDVQVIATTYPDKNVSVGFAAALNNSIKKVSRCGLFDTACVFVELAG